jgi:hypothetical protein
VPIQIGSPNAEVEVDLGQYRVRRRWTARGTTLKVTAANGEPVTSPQALLDKLIGSISFEALSFYKMKKREQGQVLRDLVGLDFRVLDQQRIEAYNERAIHHKAAWELEAQLKDLPEVDPLVPLEERSLADLMREQELAVAKQTANNDLRATLRNQNAELARLATEHQTLEAELRRIQQRLEQNESRVAELEDTKASLEPKVAALVDPDMGDIQKRVEDTEQFNASVRAATKRRDKTVALQRRRLEALACDERIEQIDSQKAEAIANAHFPVPGLGFDGEGVTFLGVPLEQASGAERLRVGLAVAAALNPNLKMVCVRDGSLLDGEGRQVVGKWAQDAGYQVLMEIVAGDKPVGLVIEDGELAANCYDPSDPIYSGAHAKAETETDEEGIF